MKALIASALFIILGISGLQNAAANCADDYVADYHSLYLADISHTPPSPLYAEYNLYGEDGGDYDLFVWDSWNNTWYSSETAGLNEYLKVPIHSNYDHKAYVWTYNGSGSWSVCSPQVVFDAGFQRIADSDTAPDAAATTTTTTTTTESTNPEFLGRWMLTFDWDCDGSTDEDEVIFNSDSSFGDEDNQNLGEWSAEGTSVRWEHDEDPNALYRGSISGRYMSGTMSTTDGSTGCWTARKTEDT